MIDGFDAKASPRELPLTYPGQRLPYSALVRPTTAWEISMRPGRRLSQARVRIDERGLPGDDRAANSDVPLNYVLLRLNQAPVGRRYPVLSMGATPTPSFMRQVLDRPGHSLAIPVVHAQVTGLRAGVAAGVSPWGFVPTAPILDPDATRDCYVMWLDEPQLAAADEPVPGLARVFMPAEGPDQGVRVTLPSGETLSGCYVYVAATGYLNGPDGKPLELAEQHELLEGLLERSARLRHTFGDTPQSWVERARAGAWAAGTEIFAEEGWAATQPYFDALPGVDVRYDGILPHDPPPVGAVRVRATAEPADRDGDSVVRVSRPLAERIGAATHVLVRPAVPDAAEGIDVVAAILIDEDSEATDVAELDQVVRNAIGIEVGESAWLEPAMIRRRRWLDLLIGTPNYVTGRMQVADLTTVERQVCLMDPLTLELLGVDSGEEVVLEGGLEPDGQVAQARLVAFATSPEIQQRRSDLDGGDLSALFPSSRDALGVHPDLPWMFLDRRTRDALRLSKKLAPVRARSSRVFQLRREVREMMLLFGIAFIGVLQIISNQLLQVGVLLLLVLMILGGIALRMRGRLSRHTKGGPTGPWTTSTTGVPAHRRHSRRQR